MTAVSVSMARVGFMLIAWSGAVLLVLVAWRLWLRDVHPAPPAPARSVIEDTARTVELPIVRPPVRATGRAAPPGRRPCPPSAPVGADVTAPDWLSDVEITRIFNPAGGPSRLLVTHPRPYPGYEPGTIIEVVDSDGPQCGALSVTSGRRAICPLGDRHAGPH